MASLPSFSVRELLMTMTMLGIGFAWPVLLFFIVPIIIAAILARIGIGSTTPVITAASLSIALGLAANYWYWHYPVRPPALLRELRDVQSLRQLSSINDLDGKTTATATPMTAVPPASALQWNRPDSLLMPTERILEEFGKRNLAIGSQTPMSSEQLASIWQALEDAKLLLDGNPGYPDAKSLYGYAGAAHLQNGSEILFTAVMGNEYANDHYPYYEAVFEQRPEGLVIINSLWFFEDIAGIEGARWYAVSVPVFLLLMPAMLIVWPIGSKWVTRRRC
jgi:hypothetical protein